MRVHAKALVASASGSQPVPAPSFLKPSPRSELRVRALRAQIAYLRAFEARRRPAPQVGRAAQLAAKRGIDLVGAALLLVLLAPLLLVVALLIRLESRGPVLFCQDRVGLDNRTFRIFKFRSMYVDRCDVSGRAQTVAGDPRITPLGRVLRRTNVDELPQLLNVLRGDMSLIGPRPHVPAMLAAGMPYEELVSFYAERHRMRPGITGLAQAHGLRGPTLEPEPAMLRIVRDLEYIRDFSLWLDFRIAVRTVVSELFGGSGF